MCHSERLKILSIDAWRDADGWWWNDYRKVGEITREALAKLDTNRKLLAYMRRKGYFTNTSGGKVAVCEPGGEGVFIEFLARGTGEPLFAISGIH